ncbi:MAG: sulfite exporter TauE/SafE family protein [Sulfuricurvum sp.]
MCGGVVMAYSSTKIKSETPKLQAAISHLLYSLGRTATYTTLGAIFGFLGGVATLNNIVYGGMLLIAGTAMVLTSLSLWGKIRFLTFIEHSLSSTVWYRQTFRSLITSQSYESFFMLGLLNGLLPCGLVYFFAITAASTGSPLWGALVMMIFGLSTLPALFSLGYFVGAFRQSSFRGVMMKLAGFAIMIYAMLTIINGIDYIQRPEKTLLECHGGR